MANDIVTTIVGNVVANPKLGKYRNRAVCNFTVATTARYYDSQNEEWVDGPTTFVQCSQWGTPARNTAKSLAKGIRVVVHGNLFTDTWVDDDDHENLQVKMTVNECGLSTQFKVIGKSNARADSEDKGSRRRPAKTAAKKRPVRRVPDDAGDDPVYADEGIELEDYDPADFDTDDDDEDTDPESFRDD